MRVNYTSYDMRREQDSINPRTHPDIMMLAPPGSDHPYLYARVVSIFHVNAYRLDPDCADIPESELLHILWVRWFDLDTTLPGGFNHFRPHRLKPAPIEAEPFGFVSPEQVLRGIHIAPAERFGRSEQPSLPYRLLSTESRCDSDTSDARNDTDDSMADREPRKDDWNYYYIGM